MTGMDLLGVIAEPRRRRILELVWERERAAGEIASEFEVTFSAVSQHLAVLRGAGLVTERRVGKRRMYVASKAALGPLAAVLERMWSEKLGTLKSLAEVEQRSIDRKATERNAHGTGQ